MLRSERRECRSRSIFKYPSVAESGDTIALTDRIRVTGDRLWRPPWRARMLMELFPRVPSACGGLHPRLDATTRFAGWNSCPDDPQTSSHLSPTARSTTGRYKLSLLALVL